MTSNAASETDSGYSLPLSQHVASHLPLRAERVGLRLLEERDADRYSLGVNDERTRRYAYLPPGDYSVDAVRKKIQDDYRDALEAGVAAYLAIVDAETDECLGSMVLFDFTNDDAEIGFWLVPDTRSRGVAVDAVNLVGELAKRAGLAGLRARVEMGNDAAMRVLERAGYAQAGEPQPPKTEGIGDFLLQPFALRFDDEPWQARLASKLAQVADATEVPGATVAVLHRGELTELAHGVLNLRTGVRATPDSIFQIGSISKIWTATLVFQLVDDGLIELDAPVHDYLPEFRVADEQATHTIRVRDLLSHRGGFDGDLFTDTGRGSDAIARFVASLHSAEQYFMPGEQFAYNNAGWVVLGRLVEVMRDGDYVNIVRERLFEPLQLDRAVALPEDALLYRAAAGHTRDADGKAMPMGSWSLPFSTAPTGAALTMSAGNLARFAEIFLRGGASATGSQILSNESAKAIWEPVLTTPVPGFVGDHFGMGAFSFDYIGGMAFGHDGQTVGQTAYLRVLPEHDLVIVLLTNRDSPIQLFEAVVGFVLESLTPVRLSPVPEPPQQPLPANAELIAGNYANNSLTAEVTVDDEGSAWIRLGSPNLDLGNQPAMQVAALSDNTFVSKTKGDAPAVPFYFFDRDGDGIADFLYFMRMLKRVE